MRVLLSFNPDDVALAEAFRASLFVASPELEVFFSPILFDEYRPLEFQHADAFVLFIGWHGLTDQQMREYRAAIERSGTDSQFVVLRVLVGGAQAPEILPRNLTWIEAPVVTDRNILQRVVVGLGQSGGLTDKTAVKTSASRHDRAVGHSR